MPREIITAPDVTPYRSGLSHAVKAAGLVFVSGATPFTGARAANLIARGDFAAQTHQVMQNIKAILAAAGTSLDRAVKMNVALADMKNYAEFDAIFKTYFAPGNYPARQTTESVHLSHMDFMLSVDCIAEA
ncbi:RidA family protein [Humitalea sp. 24SJ18S-53]|uniref:RidA family protein n=1 Tax=Humitalea sp. 24SJ18S-53 TaxID=3422307 RepID=UPI003D66E8CE